MAIDWDRYVVSVAALIQVTGKESGSDSSLYFCDPVIYPQGYVDSDGNYYTPRLNGAVTLRLDLGGKIFGGRILQSSLSFAIDVGSSDPDDVDPIWADLDGLRVESAEVKYTLRDRDSGDEEVRFRGYLSGRFLQIKPNSTLTLKAIGGPSELDQRVDVGEWDKATDAFGNLTSTNSCHAADFVDGVPRKLIFGNNQNAQICWLSEDDNTTGGWPGSTSGSLGCTSYTKFANIDSSTVVQYNAQVPEVVTSGLDASDGEYIATGFSGDPYPYVECDLDTNHKPGLDLGSFAIVQGDWHGDGSNTNYRDVPGIISWFLFDDSYDGVSSDENDGYLKWGTGSGADNQRDATLWSALEGDIAYTVGSGKYEISMQAPHPLMIADERYEHGTVREYLQELLYIGGVDMWWDYASDGDRVMKFAISDWSAADFTVERWMTVRDSEVLHIGTGRGDYCNVLKLRGGPRLGNMSASDNTPSTIFHRARTKSSSAELTTAAVPEVSRKHEFKWISSNSTNWSQLVQDRLNDVAQDAPDYELTLAHVGMQINMKDIIQLDTGDYAAPWQDLAEVRRMDITRRPDGAFIVGVRASTGKGTYNP